MKMPRYPLGVDFMDRDHAVLEALLERTPEIADADMEAHFEAAAAELAAHFVREEAEMEKARLSILHCHRGQHQAVLQEIDRLRGEFAVADSAMRRHIVGFNLIQLFSHHVAGVDLIAAILLLGEDEDEEAPACGASACG